MTVPIYDSWTAFQDTPAYYAWRGNAFEIVCIHHIDEIKRAIGIAPVETECFPWLSSQTDPKTQIDLVTELGGEW